MSENPIGTVADRNRLVELRAEETDDGRAFLVDEAVTGSAVSRVSLVDALDADAATVDAARRVHRRQAERLLRTGAVDDADDADEEALEEPYEAVVLRREID
ncbi:hypothetical protein [Haloprofundus halobius]|uniref:hypothetical protein n=1 Tax=Haloprofundus halobius TaxID=2876194 RepID=UPI001CCD521E|nr:hypothetical protein [Haloprofundus halobius]